MPDVPSISQLRSGPPAVDLPTAAAVLRIGRTKAYELAKQGLFPVPVRRIGTSYRVPVAGLLEYLGISEDVPARVPVQPVPAPRRPLAPRTPY